MQQPGEFSYLCGVKRFGIILLAALAVASCGLTRRAPGVREPDAPIIPPLTDSADIARTRARAQAVMDSIDLVLAGVTVPKSDEGIRTSTGIVPLPEPPKELVDELLDYAKTFIGVPYLLGASGPERFDCSGFTSYVFKRFGIQLDRSSRGQIFDGVRVKKNDLQPGDLVFFQGRSGRGGVGHVGIVTRVNDDNTFHFIHSACSSGVTESKNTESYYSRRYVGACRVL